MKRFVWAFILLIGASPAWCAKRITVEQLEQMLRSLQQERKSDADVAAALTQVELSQELTRTVMNSLVGYAPGPQSTEQIYALEAKSADLVPPSSDLPEMPAPDATEQKAILDKAATYVTGVYEQLPDLTATKMTLRFQDNVDAVSASSGIQGSARDVVTDAGFSSAAAYVHYVNSTETQVTSEHGAEKMPAQKDKTPWGANTMIALETPDPDLGRVFREAQDAGTLQWQRWELISGKQTAVYSFVVPRKKSHFDVNVCCFPKVNQAGVATFYTAATAGALSGGTSIGGAGGVTGNFQTSTDWHNYKSTVPYHGEIFIDPETGVVLRMITQAEFKPAEVVHQIDTRVDYGAVKAGARTMIAPVKMFVNTIVVPQGDSGARSYTTRCTLFTSEYKDYQLTGGK
jgi:hypothetical protein